MKEREIIRQLKKVSRKKVSCDERKKKEFIVAVTKKGGAGQTRGKLWGISAGPAGLYQ